MKKPIILATHIGAGGPELMQVLAENPRVQCYRTGRIYQTVTDLEFTTDKSHKCQTRAAVYVDEVVYNHHIQAVRILDVCQFIYLVREPLPAINEILAMKMLQPGPALRYYCYRLRRLCEMARKTPGAVVLTWDDVATGRGYPLLEKYLRLKDPLRVCPEAFKPGNRNRGVYSLAEVQLAEQTYERYLSYLWRLNVVRSGVIRDQV